MSECTTHHICPCYARKLFNATNRVEWFRRAAIHGARVDNLNKVHIDNLEHELGRLREVLRRIIGYVDSVRSVAGLEAGK